MKVGTIMSPGAACCTKDTPLRDAAALMVELDCGALPVVDSRQSRRPLGVVTDRDIVCRVVAMGKNPLELTVAECMSSPAVTVTADMDVEQCCRLMAQHKLRRVVVVDADGACCGMVAQADVATKAAEGPTARVLKQVSKLSATPSDVGAGERRTR
jgi:CBS domain-containing protein